MNLPNKFTIARAALVPVFLTILLIPAIPNRFLWACVIFSVASITDFLDGKIARSRNIVTNFGKFLDPLADKLLVTAALVAFVELGLASSAAIVIIIGRDLMVSGIRMLAATSEGKVIAANWWGKVKTALQMVVIIAVLLLGFLLQNSQTGYQTLARWSNIAIWVLAIYTLLSGFAYLIQNKHLVNYK